MFRRIFGRKSATPAQSNSPAQSNFIENIRKELFEGREQKHFEAFTNNINHPERIKAYLDELNIKVEEFMDRITQMKENNETLSAEEYASLNKLEESVNSYLDKLNELKRKYPNKGITEDTWILNIAHALDDLKKLPVRGGGRKRRSRKRKNRRNIFY
jgi:DNA repair exonuclease SbcCD ATPase subunit